MCHIVFVLPFVGLILFWLMPFEQALIFYSFLLLVSAVVYWLMWKDMRRPAATGIEGMVGGRAEVIQNGNGALKVFFRGEIWDAVSHDDVPVGEKVEIVGTRRMEKMRLLVRR
ncbi:MAG: hypothetical protein HYV04_04030 [Deltaproteobacteria bacterium]|nr:hypothetical protein [Deltaproteobacteria bacterium]